MEFLLAADNVADELDVEKISQDVSRLAKFTDSMVDKLINFGFSILVAIIIFVIGKIIIKFVRKFVKKLLLKSTVDLGVVKFIDSIIKVVGYVMVLIIICGEIGIQTTSFINRWIIHRSGTSGKPCQLCRRRTYFGFKTIYNRGLCTNMW